MFNYNDFFLLLKVNTRKFRDLSMTVKYMCTPFSFRKNISVVYHKYIMHICVIIHILLRF